MKISRLSGALPDHLQTLIHLDDAEFIQSESPMYDVESNSADACIMELTEVPSNLPELEIAAFLERTVMGEVSTPIPLEDARSVSTDSSRVAVQSESFGITPVSSEEEADVVILTRAWAEELCPGQEFHPVDPDMVVPAPGQGTAVILCRKGDSETIRTLRGLDHRPTRITVTVERGIQHLSGLGPLSPLGICAELEGMQLRVRCFNRLPDGSERRVDCCLFVDYVMDDLLDLAEYLNGKRSETLSSQSATY